MKRLMIVVAFLLLAGVGGAQVSMIPKGGGGGGASTITSGSTATSGCLDGAPLRSSSNTVVCTKMDTTDYIVADETDSVGSYIDSGISVSVAANTVYLFSCRVHGFTAAGTTAIQVAFNGPASPTLFSYSGSAQQSTTASTYPYGSTYDATNALPASTPGASIPTFQQYAGILSNGANAGALTLRFRTEIGTSLATLMAGSFCRVWTP